MLVSVLNYPSAIAKSGAIFIIMMLLMSVLLFLLLRKYLPETRGLSVEEIVRHFGIGGEPSDVFLDENNQCSFGYGSIGKETTSPISNKRVYFD